MMKMHRFFLKILEKIPNYIGTVCQSSFVVLPKMVKCAMSPHLPFSELIRLIPSLIRALDTDYTLGSAQHHIHAILNAYYLPSNVTSFYLLTMR